MQRAGDGHGRQHGEAGGDSGRDVQPGGEDQDRAADEADQRADQREDPRRATEIRRSGRSPSHGGSRVRNADRNPEVVEHALGFAAQ